MILTLGQAFEVAYQITLREQISGNRRGNGHTRSQSANQIVGSGVVTSNNTVGGGGSTITTTTTTGNNHSRSLSVNEMKMSGDCLKSKVEEKKIEERDGVVAVDDL